jgi:hypothetical protein
MHASVVKAWTVKDGDFIRCADQQRDDSYEALKRDRSNEKVKVTIGFGLTALGAIVLVLELLTRI